MKYHKVLVAGATGYLGKYILRELKKQGYNTTAIARDPSRLNGFTVDKVLRTEVTQPQLLEDICYDIDCFISTIGITKQKDGLTYMDVDYQANVNLLQEAQKDGVKKFIYVSVLNGHLMRNLKMIEAKEKFVDELKNSGMDYIIIRPNGFFSDMAEILNMAQKGRVYLFGDGEYKGNPIHGKDLAEFIIKNMSEPVKELEVGGPEVLTQNEIAHAAFNATGKKEKIVHIPGWISNASLRLIRWLSDQKTYGPVEFFMTVMNMDMVTNEYGEQRLSDFFKNTYQERSFK
jgi:uncharacterized protein YbjT (DUF2867 family)